MHQLSQLEYFGRALVDIGTLHEDLVVLDPDVSASTKTSYFAERFPERFFNVGISEQDMMGIAAGLAASGKTPIACGFAIFVAGRAWEQIANSVARPNLNVKIVATHSGLSPFADGDSHQSFGDIALMRVLPNMKVVVPADAIEAVEALKAIVLCEGPAYLRLGRGATAAVYNEAPDFAIGKASLLREGNDATVVACGVTVSMAIRAAAMLGEEGVDVRVVDMHTIKPIDAKCIIDATKDTGALVTAEEHSVMGGLGSAVSEIVSQTVPAPIQMVGIRDRFGESSRDYWSLLAEHGLTADEIIKAVHRVLGMKG